MEAPLSTKPIRRVLRWQALATVAGAAVAAPWGWDAAWSALLGGVVYIAAVAVYAVVLGIANPATGGGTVAAMFRAEASKILVVIGALWLVLTTYKDVVPLALFATFAITVLMFRMALYVRD